MLLSHILSLIGCALTGLQTFLILYRGNGLCFNEGCEIVDSLSLLPPLYFNVVGFLFFLFISFGISQARKGSELWQRFTSLLLLAAIAAVDVAGHRPRLPRRTVERNRSRFGSSQWADREAARQPHSVPHNASPSLSFHSR